LASKLLSNVRYYLPEWSLYIFHSEENKAFVQNILKKVIHRKNIHLIEFRKDNMNIHDYSRLLTSASFWDKVDAENILIFQTDSFLVKKGLEDILQYNFAYIGAPWAHIPEVKQAGNGGLSLRKKSWMLRCIEQHPWQENLPEDLYFHYTLTELNAELPSVDLSKTIFVENIYHPQPYGYHQHWKHPFDIHVFQLE
jgi:hypothetical protein